MFDTETKYRLKNLLYRFRYLHKLIKKDTHLKNRLVIFLVLVATIFTIEGVHEINSIAFSYISFYAKFIVFLSTFIALELYFRGQGYFSLRYKNALSTIAFDNALKEVPILIEQTINDKKINIIFDSVGVSIDKWKNTIFELENVLNITISSIDTGKTDSEIIIHGCIGKYNWSNTLKWNNSKMIEGHYLLIGDSIGEKKIVNISQYAHLLIGGMTGSGKTILLKTLLFQCILKKYEVYIADFKQGVDFPFEWRDKCSFLFEREDVLKKLQQIASELDNRLKLLSDNNCKNIDVYNYKNKNKINRIIFSCDEIAELMDSIGMSKEEKNAVKEIEKYISKIARLGRAVGIHLILATQRPDADVLNGQIKSNMTYRLCGKSNEVLSRIIIDSTDAAKMISADDIGVFINQYGQKIKAYYVDDNVLSNFNLSKNTNYNNDVLAALGRSRVNVTEEN